MMLIIAALSLAAGASVALLAGRLPLPVGVVGGLLLVISALWVRRHWRRAAAGAPAPLERELWMRFATAGAVLGHMLASLWRIGPQLALHTPEGHALGIDSWSLAIAGAIAWWCAREGDARRDERDALINAHGLRWHYGSLLVLLLPGVMLLGFPTGAPDALSRPFIAHLVIAAMIASAAIGYGVRLRSYRLDARGG